MDYDLELERVVSLVKSENASTVCVQLPDGLKPEAGRIVDYVKEKTGALVFVWLGSCFGACDIPQGLENVGVDVLVQWGHSEFR